jgi:hypothetical protein
MSVFQYFDDYYIRNVYPTLKHVYSKRSKALFLYSEKFNQVIYIKQTKTKIKSRDMKALLRRGIDDIERLFKQEYGARQGTKLFNNAYKTHVIVCPKMYKPVYRHLRALNRLGKTDPHFASKTFNSHNWHMIFDLSKLSEEIIAGTVYKALYEKMHHQLETTNQTFKQREKTPYSKVKTNLMYLEQSSQRLLTLYYRFTGKKHIATKDLEAEISHEVEMLRLAKPLYPEGYSPEITIEESKKESFKKETEVQ